MSVREIKFRVWYHPEKKMYYRGYQKLTHVLLCREENNPDEIRGVPELRADYDDCEMLEGTGISDVQGREIFEGDIVQICFNNNRYRGVLQSVPDMYRSRGLHPLNDLLQQVGIDKESAEQAVFEVLGNRFENPELL